MVLNCAGETRKRDVTTMFTYSHANTPLGQSERAYYLSYFIISYIRYAMFQLSFALYIFKDASLFALVITVL